MFNFCLLAETGKLCIESVAEQTNSLKNISFEHSQPISLKTEKKNFGDTH